MGHAGTVFMGLCPVHADVIVTQIGGMWYIATMMSYCSIMQDIALKEFQSLENCLGKLTFGSLAM